MKIAKWSVLLLIFVLVQAFPSFSQSNLLVNGSFEESSGGKPVKWETWNSKINLSQTTDYVKSGQYAAKTEATTSSTNYIFQVVEIDPSDNYYAEAYGLKISGEAIFLRIAWYEATDGSGSQSSTVDSGTVVSNSTSFTHIYTDTLTPPSGAKSAAVRLVIRPNDDGSGVAFFDGVGFYQGKSPYKQENQQGRDQQQEPQLTISFSTLSSVVVDTPFSVSVTLKNFKLGTYTLKILIGKGSKFYDGRTKGTNGKWLAWNASWVDFPKVTVGSSGSGSKTVQAKTDDDVVAGEYLIKVRAHKDNDSFDSGAKSVTVTGTAGSESIPGAEGTSEAAGDEGVGPSFAEATEGEVLGEESPSKGLKLNFYIILGIFGMLVGSGGLILAFRRGARRSQTPDTPEPERGPL